MDRHDFRKKRSDSVPEGLQEKYTFNPIAVPNVRRANSKDDILKFYRYFDLVQSNNSLLFTWKHYLSILQEQLSEFDFAVSQSRAIICGMSSSASSQTSVYRTSSEGNAIQVSPSGSDLADDIVLEAAASKGFVFSPEVQITTRFPPQENRQFASELLSRNDLGTPPNFMISRKSPFHAEMSPESKSVEDNANVNDSCLTVKTNITPDSRVEMTSSESGSGSEVLDNPSLEQKEIHIDTCLAESLMNDLKISFEVNKGLTQDVCSVPDKLPTKTNAFGLLAESQLDQERLRADACSVEYFMKNKKTASIVEEDTSQDGSYVTVLENFSSETLAEPVKHDFRKASAAGDEFEDAAIFLPEHDSIQLAEKSLKISADELRLKTDVNISAESGAATNKKLSSHYLSCGESTVTSVVSSVSKMKALKIIKDIKRITKGIQKTVERISSLSSCGKCGASLHDVDQSDTCLKPIENAGDMATNLKTSSKKIPVV